MKVGEAMTAEVRSVEPDTPLKDVARLLTDEAISGVPVVDNGTLVGVVSEADFLTIEAQGTPKPKPKRGALWWAWAARDADEPAERFHAVTAGQAMSAPPITISSDRPLSEAAGLMVQRRINRLPVVDGGRLVGIITRADVVRAFARDDAELLQILRNSLRAVDGLRVVAVQNGVAVLAGTVPHETIAQTARNVALHTEGIVDVDDRGVSWSSRPGEWPPDDAVTAG